MEDLVSRETYKKVKRMDRKEMNEFLNGIYALGEQSADGVTFDKVIKRIKEIPGIGDKRLQQIADAISPLYVDKDDDGDDSE